jgi:hypothetical protein
MEWDGRKVFGHDGGTLGQGAFLRILPDAGLAVCLQVNGRQQLRELFQDVYGEAFSSLAGVELPPPMELRPFDGDVLVARGADDDTWNAAVFLDLDGVRRASSAAPGRRPCSCRTPSPSGTARGTASTA